MTFTTVLKLLYRDMCVPLCFLHHCIILYSLFNMTVVNIDSDCPYKYH